MNDESETPRERAYRLAFGTSSASTVIVSFVFIGVRYSPVYVYDSKRAVYVYPERNVPT